MEDVKGSYRPTTDDNKQKRGSSFDLTPYHSHKWSERVDWNPASWNLL